jgi:hypothetical protein
MHDEYGTQKKRDCSAARIHCTHSKNHYNWMNCELEIHLRNKVQVISRTCGERTDCKEHSAFKPCKFAAATCAMSELGNIDAALSRNGLVRTTKAKVSYRRGITTVEDAHMLGPLRMNCN